MLESLITNVFHLLGFFVLLLLIFHVFLVWWFKLDEIAWKKVEYIWLLFAALGLITLSSDIRRWVSGNLYEIKKNQTVAVFDRIRIAIDRVHPSYICFKFIRHQYSPENFGEIQKERDEACDWYRRISKSLPKSVIPEFPILSFNAIPPPSNLTDPIIIESFEELKSLFEEYGTNREKMNTLKKKTFWTDLELFLRVFSPLFLCIALSLRITKVTGEIRLKNLTRQCTGQ